VATDRLQLNEAKCREHRISLSRLEVVGLEPVKIKDKELACVSSFVIVAVLHSTRGEVRLTFITL